VDLYTTTTFVESEDLVGVKTELIPETRATSEEVMI